MLIGQPREVLQNSLITFPVINEESNHPFSQNVENHRLLWLNWLHKTTLGLTIFSALLAKGGFFKHILARMFDCTKFPRHAMHHTKKLQFFYSAPDQSKHGKQALTQAHKQCWLPASYVSMYGCNSLASQTFKQHHECFVLLKLSCWKSVCKLVCQSVIS